MTGCWDDRMSRHPIETSRYPVILSSRHPVIPYIPTTDGVKVKRDATIALIAAVVTAGICYGLAVIKLDLKPTISSPFSTSLGEKSAAGHVIIRVNGEPVTEEEFAAAFAQLPEDMQHQLATPQGKSSFAEQVVRYKLLEQEALRMGV